MKKKLTDIKPIAFRPTSSELKDRIDALAEELGVSMNIATNLLVAYAFKQVDKNGHKFVLREQWLSLDPQPERSTTYAENTTGNITNRTTTIKTTLPHLPEPTVEPIE